MKRLELIEEFKRLCHADKVDQCVAFVTANKNMRLNRWKNVLANEATLFPPPPGPYLNGNLLEKKAFNAPIDFVACQAPMPVQFGDFYSTIAKFDVPLVIMLTQEKEGSSRKAHAYWPSSVNREVVLQNGITIEIIKQSVDTRHNLVSRRIRVTPPNADPHEFEHILFLGWPDFGIPNDTDAFLHLVDILRAVSSQGGPVIVHCSAGIGRTGTLLAVYYGRQLLDRGEALTYQSIGEVIVKMKRARTGMVQRPEQLDFIYQCLGLQLLGSPI